MRLTDLLFGFIVEKLSTKELDLYSVLEICHDAPLFGRHTRSQVGDQYPTLLGLPSAIAITTGGD